jgi:hypothetical protein
MRSWIQVLVSWKQPLAQMQGKAVYIRTKVVRPFPRPCASGSYVHQVAPLLAIGQ